MISYGLAIANGLAMPAPRRALLAPSFVVVLAACTGGGDGFDVISNPPPPETDCIGCGPHPPAPPPVHRPQPELGVTVTQAKAPPSLGSASMIVTSDGKYAVATDPDRDRVVIAELATDTIREVAVAADSVPGRLVEDAEHKVHVVLERGKSVVTIDVATGSLAFSREVCGAPQGIARSGSDLFVACADGEIVKLPIANEPGTRLVRTLVDLRDIVASGDSLLVSRLRSAEVLRVRASDGTLLDRAGESKGGPGGRERSVGWRLAANPAGGAVLVHQLASAALVPAQQPNAYVGENPCDGSVVSEVTQFRPDEHSGLALMPDILLGDAVLPVDLVASPDGSTWAVIAAGNGHTPSLPQVHLLGQLTGSTTECSVPAMMGVQTSFRGPPTRARPTVSNPPGQAVAAAFSPDSGTLVVFTREPAAFHVRSVAGLSVSGATGWKTLPAGGESREDTGHAIFHSNTGGRIACASCHPNGADDGRVWSFSSGPRRTQTLRGTLAGTAPYHWGGDAPDMQAFATDVFTGKMGGQSLRTDQVTALTTWAERIPVEPTSTSLDPAAVAHGKTLFESSAVGCSSCHTGPKLTNNASVNVGTGGTFQVPSLLGLAVRAPYLHDGSTASFFELVGSLNRNNAHGKTTHLTGAERLDLAAYLASL